MRLEKALLKGVWASVAAAILLAFAWPALVSSDPASAAFEALAKATLVVFFVALAAVLVLRARRIGRR